MFSPASNRLRDATATVRTRSPLGTPPLSASETNSFRPTTESPTLAPQDKLTHIFNAVRQQIQRWGDNARWKIDLVLLDNNNNNATATNNSGTHSIPGSPAPPHHAAPSPRAFMPPHPPPTSVSQLLPEESDLSVGHHQGYMLPVSRTTQYPMDYATPAAVPTETSIDELKQQLHDSFERQRYLENIVRSQAEQIQESQMYPPDANKAIETMRSIYMMSENEQKLRYLMDTKTVHKDMEALSRKLKRLTSTLHSIETMKLPTEDAKLDRETLLEERKILKRKLHLAELRLNARDAELEYLYQVAKSSNSHPSYYPHHEVSSSPKLQHQQLASFTSSPRRGPPYLFQQQYSPKMRHEIRPPPLKQPQSPLPPPAQSPQPPTSSAAATTASTTNAVSPPTTESQTTQQQQQQQQQHHLSALESLGIVADRMLSDPDFSRDDKDAHQEARRSKRSIDSANALLSMPTLKFPARKDNDVIAEEPESKDSGSSSKEPASKKARLDSPRGQPPPDARQSPTIAALLDRPASSSPSSSTNVSSTPPPIHVSPHATPPLAHAHEAKATGAPGPSSSSRVPSSEPGYRPPSPASTPKRVRQQHQAG